MADCGDTTKTLSHFKFKLSVTGHEAANDGRLSSGLAKGGHYEFGHDRGLSSSSTVQGENGASYQ